MSLRLEMLQVARLAPAVLSDGAELIADFTRSCQSPDGGFQDRDGKSDLYYTSFAIDILTALQLPLPEDRLVPYLQSFGNGEGLDFVHLCCLARCWSAMTSTKVDVDILSQILARIETYRTPEGGYEQNANSKHGSAYGSLLAWGSYADHRREVPNAELLTISLDSLKTKDDSWANDTWMPIGSAPATAAAVTLLRSMRKPVPPKTHEFLLHCFHLESGGFLPFPDAPMPDLLSTAVTLHALDGLQIPFTNLKDPCLDYIDTLWTADGGFHGNWTDDQLDLEYTFYGILALGHLAL